MEVPDPARLSYLTQTTLSVDETNQIVDVLAVAVPGDPGHRLARTSATQHRTARTP